ncbi:response regulator transcription factor [Bifidobacterium parmae]|uniref:Winged helix family two component transcriptional regulator n=1 Tax=Bifidobacterium parmae TaxID=361854 RepID=A0A2N5IYY0_9BIFI|nr:response regulator transcription factor [Bifidobacterium parmae]PLS27169.1 winged helix family two component transcriptional regulator [Bifidobacterium parmae]
MRLLVAVEGVALSRAITGTLERAGHVVTTVEPALAGTFGSAVTDALRDDENAPFDAVIVDTPQALATASSMTPHVRSLLLATTSSPAPEHSPDATLRMPFSDTELLAYVEMLSRESNGLGAKSMIIRGDLTLDLANRKAYFASTHRPMPLSRLEYDVLEALVKANGRFVDLEELQRGIGGYFAGEGLIRSALYTLDRKLRRAGLNLNRHGDSFRVM